MCGVPSGADNPQGSTAAAESVGARVLNPKEEEAALLAGRTGLVGPAGGTRPAAPRMMP
jgi:hypothetical protein